MKRKIKQAPVKSSIPRRKIRQAIKAVNEEQRPLGQGLSEGLKELYGDEYEKLRNKDVK